MKLRNGAVAILSLGAVLAVIGLVLTGMSFAGDDPKIHAVLFMSTPLLLLGAALMRNAKEQSIDEK